MPTPYVYALLADLSYNDPAQGYTQAEDLGWAPLATSNPTTDDDFGYFGVAFVNRATREIVIAHRGTNQLFGHDFDDDFGLLDGLANNNVPQQYGSAGIRDVDNIGARKFIDDVHQKIALNSSIQDFTVSYTGHSLGAVLAELSAAQDRLTAVTFDSPGSLSIMQMHPEYGFNPNVPIVSYLAHPNIVNTINSHAGTLYTVNPPYNFSGYRIVTSAIRIADYLQYTLQQHDRHGFVHLLDPKTNAPAPLAITQSQWPSGFVEGLIYFYSSDNSNYWSAYADHLGITYAREAFFSSIASIHDFFVARKADFAVFYNFFEEIMQSPTEQSLQGDNVVILAGGGLRYQGGEGEDLYLSMVPGLGLSIIDDSDGRGLINFNGGIVQGQAEPIGSNLWRITSPQGYTYTLSYDLDTPTRLVIQQDSNLTDQLVIENFRSGNFGIFAASETAPPQLTAFIFRKDATNSITGSQTVNE